MRNKDIRERLNVANITQRCRYAKLGWFGHVKRPGPIVRRKKDPGDGATREKKKRKTEAEMDGLCQPRHESYRDNNI